MKGVFVVFASNIEDLTGHIDESISKGSRIFTLSALVGIGTEWGLLSTEWEAMIAAVNTRLRSLGRPQISRYHASECNARDEEFEGWSQDEQVTLTQEMLALLKRYPLKMISYSIDLIALKKAIPEHDLIGSSYAIGTMFLVYALGAWLSEKSASPNTRLTLIHDRCCYDEEILRRFNSLISDPEFRHRHYFTTCAPMGWENCTPLQPADLVAYEGMKDTERRFDSRRQRITFGLIMTEGNMGIRNYIIGAKAIESDNMKQLLGVLDLPVKSRRKKKPMSARHPKEFKQFSEAMDTILKADPDAVKAAMEAEKREREIQQRITGKRGRGRPPKPSASSHASSEKD